LRSKSCPVRAATGGAGSVKSFAVDRHSRNHANSGAINSWQSTGADVTGSAVKPDVTLNDACRDQPAIAASRAR
jgi:hypothetical protein